MKKIISWIMLLVVAMFMLPTLGCMRPYQVELFEEVEAYETAFVIPWEGDSEEQDAFGSADLLLEKKVAAKRIPTPTRWHQTKRGLLFGLLDIRGEWIKTILVLKVDRTPVSKQFTAAEGTGSSKKNQALYAESKDSIGVSSGFAITAVILEEDAHLFLNKFKGDALAEVMDNQIFNSVQSIYTEVCNEFDLKELRAEKQTITEKMRTDVIPMYKKWGITINEDMGLIGGFVYEDADIQNAINDVFVNQTMKEANEALLAAQKPLNEQKLLEKENMAAMVIVDAKAEADAIALVAKAINDAGPIYIQNKQLEVMRDGITKWDGEVPRFMGSSMPFMFNMDAADATAAQ